MFATTPGSWLICVSLGLMQTEDVVFFTCKIAIGLLLATLDAVLTVMFAHAYRRSRRLFFLLFAVSAFVSGLMNLYDCAQIYAALAHITIFPRLVLHVIAWTYVSVDPFVSIISFVGSILMIRFVLSQHAKT